MHMRLGLAILGCLLLVAPVGGQATTAATTQAATMPATTQAAAQRWVVQVTPIEQSKRQGAVEGEHVLVFGDERLRVEGALGEQFEPAPVERRGGDFRSQFADEFRGMVLWVGEFVEDGQSIRGIVRHTQRDGKILTYRFSGQLTPE